MGVANVKSSKDLFDEFLNVQNGRYDDNCNDNITVI